MLRFISFFMLLSSLLFSVEIKMGGGIFDPATKGTILYQNNLLEGSNANLDNSDQYHGYVWTDIKLSLPYEPHILIEYGHIRSAGVADVNIVIANDFITTVLKGTRLNNLKLYSILNQDNYDLFVYFDVFKDDPLPLLAFGIGLKSFTYNFLVRNVFTDFDITDNGGATVPMLYTNMSKEFEEYFLGFDVGMKYYVFGDSDIYDLHAKIHFDLDITDRVDVGVELGYRDTNFKIKGNDINHVAGNMRYQGVFAGVTASFR